MTFLKFCLKTVYCVQTIYSYIYQFFVFPYEYTVKNINKYLYSDNIVEIKEYDFQNLTYYNRYKINAWYNTLWNLVTMKRNYPQNVQLLDQFVESQTRMHLFRYIDYQGEEMTIICKPTDFNDQLRKNIVLNHQHIQKNFVYIQLNNKNDLTKAIIQKRLYSHLDKQNQLTALEFIQILLMEGIIHPLDLIKNNLPEFTLEIVYMNKDNNFVEKQYSKKDKIILNC